MSDDHKVHMFDLQKIDKKTKKPTFCCIPAPSDRNVIKCIDVIPGSSNFVTCGVGKHFYTWSLNGEKLKPTKVKAAKADTKAIFSTVKHSPTMGVAFASCSDGNVYVL
jgi:WD40 repeat protein